MKRLTILGLAALAALPWQLPSASAQTAAVEKIYADLAMLPVAERASISRTAPARRAGSSSSTPCGVISAPITSTCSASAIRFSSRAGGRHRLAGRHRAPLRRGDRRPPPHRCRQCRVARSHGAAAKDMWPVFQPRRRGHPAALPRIHRSARDAGRPGIWSEHGISYNSSLVPKDKAPTGWNDLCNPFFKGSVSFDPAEDRYLAGLYAMLGEPGTEGFSNALGRTIPSSSAAMPNASSSCSPATTCCRATTISIRASPAAKKPRAPYAIVYSAPAFGFAGVAAINKNAPHPYAAALWADWSLTQESQTYVARRCADRSRSSIRSFPTT